MNQEIQLFAIIGPRNEEDVIYATVKHMFTQGASRVFILDGGSTDSTREEAIDAGAEIVGIQKTEYYDDLLRCTEMHNIMRKKLDDSGLDKVWVAFLDSDEFLMSPSEKLTLHEFLSALSPVYNVVGGDNYNHFPVNKPYYIPRFHPLDFQPYYERFDSSDFHHGCPQNHWKHNVQLYIRGKRYPYNSGKGFHGFDNESTEPSTAILIHHFPYRDKEATYKRYSEIATRLKKGCGITKRGKSLDFVYSQQWDMVDNLQIHKPSKGIKLKKGEISNKKYRWYSEQELQRTIEKVLAYKKFLNDTEWYHRKHGNIKTKKWFAGRITINNKKINLLQDRKDLTRLFEFLVRFNLNSLLEIGSFEGGNLIAWSCIINNRGLLVNVDKKLIPEVVKKQLNTTHCFYSIHGNLNMERSRIKADVQSVSKFYDIVFIDANHSYESTKEDFNTFAPFAKKFIILHDIYTHEDTVLKFLKEEIVPNYPKVFIIPSPSDAVIGYGITDKNV